MLKIIETPEFTATCPVEVPGGAPGQTFRATCIAIGRAEIEQLLLADVAGRALADRVLRRVEDVVDGDGTPLPWDDGLRALLLDQLWFCAALRNGFVAELTRARRGN